MGADRLSNRPWEVGPVAKVARTIVGLKHYNTFALRGLRSTFAVDQLAGLVSFLGKGYCLSWLPVIFGWDVPLEAYGRLREDLHSKAVAPPPIKLVPRSALHDHSAAYERESSTILISDKLLDEALGDEFLAWKLMIALVEEFGHHIDNLLRTHYSQVGGDGPLDEGAAYAYAVINIDYDRTRRKPFATYVHLGHELDLYVDYSHFHEAIKEHLSYEEILSDDRNGTVEYFGPGRPQLCFGHEAIEDSLKDCGFDAEERKEVYFGNWLRDYSQICDPKLIRGDKERLGFTRETLTEVVNILAEAEFGRAAKYKVDKARLGVYRPEEHIDNPQGMEDGTQDDPAFRGKCTAEEVAVDPKSGMKRYIGTPGSWATSSGYIARELRAAIAAGRTAEGRRHLGAALHTLEDYYAHTNFVELMLLKHGKPAKPWTAKAAGGPYEYPVVSGTFGGLDTAASILATIGIKLQSPQEFRPGEWTTSQKLVYILLRDQLPNLVGREKPVPHALRKIPGVTTIYETWGSFRGWVSGGAPAEALKGALDFVKDIEKTKYGRWILYVEHATIGKALQWVKCLIGWLLRAIAEQIDEAQVLFDPRQSTDPTHTQLAKDHEEHPLHGVAAELASLAARETAAAVRAAWAGAAGGTGTSGSIGFPQGKSMIADLPAPERLKLDQLAQQIQSSARVTLIGHASAEGSEQFNLALSRERAQQVADYLREHCPATGVQYVVEAAGEAGATGDFAWRRVDVSLGAEPGGNAVQIATGFLIHPDDTEKRGLVRLDNHVLEWAEKHPDALAAALKFERHYKRVAKIREAADQVFGAAERQFKAFREFMEEWQSKLGLGAEGG